MTTGPKPRKPCDRCGRVRQVKGSQVTNICQDCKEADPAYVQAVIGRKKIA